MGSLVKSPFLTLEIPLLLRQRSNNLGPHPPPLPGQGDYYGGQGGYQGGYQVLGGYDQAKLSQFQSGVDYKIFQFEPWNPENILGPKNWIAKVLPSKTRVVLKLWDAWKFDDTAQNHEASIYLHLQSLWRTYIPCLHAKTPLDYFHALIIQYVKVYYYCPNQRSKVQGSPVSASNLTVKAENEILKAFALIHALGVIHGDIRAENILIADEAAWIHAIRRARRRALTTVIRQREVFPPPAHERAGKERRRDRVLSALCQVHPA